MPYLTVRARAALVIPCDWEVLEFLVRSSMDLSVGLPLSDREPPFSTVSTSNLQGDQHNVSRCSVVWFVFNLNLWLLRLVHTPHHTERTTGIPPERPGRYSARPETPGPSCTQNTRLLWLINKNNWPMTTIKVVIGIYCHKGLLQFEPKIIIIKKNKTQNAHPMWFVRRDISRSFRTWVASWIFFFP